jgi:DNA-binding NarL/FixJ family response regulator
MAGANGYVLKQKNLESLRQSVIETLSGAAAISAGVAFRVLNLLRNPLSSYQEKVDDYGLTKILLI